MPTISIEVQNEKLISEYTDWTKECLFKKMTKTMHILNAYYEGVYPFRITPVGEKIKFEFHYDKEIPECDVI